MQPRWASATASSNSALRRLTWVGLKTAGRELGVVERLADQGQAPPAVAHVQVHDPRLAAHQPAHVRVARDPEQLVERRLAGAVVADRQLAHAEHQIDEHNVPPHARRSRWPAARGIRR